MKLHILNMESLHSRKIVEEELKKLDLNHAPLQADEIVCLTGNASPATIAALQEILAGHGMALIEDKKILLIEKIKANIIQMVHFADKPLKTNFSNYLSTMLRYDYTYMANLFSKVQGMTIEHYIILNKIERVKELLTHGKLTLTEISYKLNYSSVAHLSNQFKKVTGFSPSHFKQAGNKE